MSDKKKWTKEEIKAEAKKFVDKYMKTYDKTCSACGANNCECNKNCHKCNCQL